MSDYYGSVLAFSLSVLLAAILTITPLPADWNAFRPSWISLVLFYWLLKEPQHFGLVTCWICGLVWDVLTAGPLGLHALAFAVQAWLILLSLHRLQHYLVLQQCLVLFMVTGIGLMLYRWLLNFLDRPSPDLRFLWSALSTALFWPFLRLLMDSRRYVSQ